MAKSVENGKFRPPQLRNRLTDFDEIRIVELSPKDHPPRKISIPRRGWSRLIPRSPLLGFFLWLFLVSSTRAQSHWWINFDDLHVI